MRKVKRIIPASLAAISLLGLSACSGTPETVEVSLPQKTPYPALTTENVQAVLKKVNTAIVQADQQNSVNPSKERLAGPALEMRAAQYKLHAADDGFKIPSFPAESEVVTQTSSTSWPKAIINITKSDPEGTKYIQVIRQDTATEPYRLEQWMRLLPDADEAPTVIPNTDVVAQGAKFYPAQETGNLVMSPIQAAQTWATVALDKDHKHAGQIVIDKQIEQMRSEQSGLAKAIGDSGKLSASVSLDQSKNNILAFGAAYDKGALVAVTYRYTTKINDVDKQKPIVLNKAVWAIAGKEAKIDREGSWTSLVSVLLWVPAKNAKNTKIQAVGAEQVLVEAKI